MHPTPRRCELRQSCGCRAAPDNQGLTQLHHAASYPSVVISQLLLQAGVAVSIRDFNSKYPLHKAAEYGQAEVVHCNPDAGADMSEVGEDSAARSLWQGMGFCCKVATQEQC